MSSANCACCIVLLWVPGDGVHNRPTLRLRRSPTRCSAIGMLAIFVWWTYDWLMILDPGSLDYLGLPLVADIGM